MRGPQQSGDPNHKLPPPYQNTRLRSYTWTGKELDKESLFLERGSLPWPRTSVFVLGRPSVTWPQQVFAVAARNRCRKKITRTESICFLNHFQIAESECETQLMGECVITCTCWSYNPHVSMNAKYTQSQSINIIWLFLFPHPHTCVCFYPLIF